ncbi:MAG: hypothetical protein ACI4RT_06760 [Candidatus Spyradenecus sp.]
MKRFVLALVTCLVALAAPATPLSELYREAAALQLPASSRLAAYDAATALAVKPDASADWATLQQTLEAGTLPENGALLAETLLALNAAAEGDLERYKARAIALKAKTTSATLRKAVDVTDLLAPCPECGGKATCTTCKGSLKCTTCKGRGTFTKSTSGGSSLSLNTTQKVRCAACKGSGKCSVCQGRALSCKHCNGNGKVPNVELVLARIAQLAGQLQAHLATQFKEDLTAREQSTLLAGELKQAQAIPDPAEALAFLNTLPPERVAAIQWSCVGALRANLEATLAEARERAAAKANQRAELRAEIAQAQRAATPLKGMVALLPLFEKYAQCDALPELHTAFDGLFAAAKSQRRLQREGLEERVAALGRLQAQPALLLDQANALLADWPEADAPKPLRDYAKQAGRTDLSAFLDERPFENARTNLERARQKAERLQAEADSAGPAWWIWAGAGLGGLFVLYVLYAAINSFLAQKAERERQARQRAALESVRATMARRRH